MAVERRIAEERGERVVCIDDAHIDPGAEPVRQYRLELGQSKRGRRQRRERHLDKGNPASLRDDGVT